MEKVKAVKRIQVEGKKHVVISEEADIEKLVQRGLTLKQRMDKLKSDLEAVQDRIIEIARKRREGSTTVTLEGVTTGALVTFRESFVVSDQIEDIRGNLGPLFDLFFPRKIEHKTTADFKKFMESGHALGVENPALVKASILEYVTTKETKPNVRMERKHG